MHARTHDVTCESPCTGALIQNMGSVVGMEEIFLNVRVQVHMLSCYFKKSVVMFYHFFMMISSVQKNALTLVCKTYCFKHLNTEQMHRKQKC